MQKKFLVLCLLAATCMVSLQAADPGDDKGKNNNQGNEKGWKEPLKKFCADVAEGTSKFVPFTACNAFFQVTKYASLYMKTVQPVFSFVAKTPLVGPWLGTAGTVVAKYGSPLLTTGYGIPVFAVTFFAAPVVGACVNKELAKGFKLGLKFNRESLYWPMLKTVSIGVGLAALGALAARCQSSSTPVGA